MSMSDPEPDAADASDKPRKYKLADVTAESREGWLAWCEAIGCTPTAFCEVIGLELREHQPDIENDLGWFDREIIAEARRLTVERRRRS